MPEKDESKKPKYETPIVVPLGEMAKGAGANCIGGSVVTDVCVYGSVPGFGCSSGGTP